MKRHNQILRFLGISLLVALTAVSTGHIVRAQAGQQSHLLFTFLTNQSGLDTGIVISNTSLDPFGTASASGACFLNFFGANAPAAFVTQTIVAGTSYTNIVSNIAPNFLGYVIADCNFPLAHGWYFHTRAGGVGFLSTNSALVLPSTFRTSSLPESLSH